MIGFNSQLINSFTKAHIKTIMDKIILGEEANNFIINKETLLFMTGILKYDVDLLPPAYSYQQLRSQWCRR